MRQTSKSQRELVLDAAEELFRASENGDFTMESLVSASGVSRASVYRLFRSRDVLLEALREERGVVFESEEDLRERILKAALELFVERGPAVTRVEDIAKKADVGPATIYRYFGDRAGLFAALAKRPPLVRGEALFPPPSPEFAGDLEAFLQKMLPLLQQRGMGMLRAALEREQHPELWEVVLKARGDQRTHLQLERWIQSLQAQGYLREGSSTDAMLVVLGTVFMFGLLADLLEMRSEKKQEVPVKFLVDVLLHGLASKRVKGEKKRKKG